MDSVFFLEEGARAHFLRSIVLSVGGTYVCLWSYYPHPSNRLFFMDGWYNDESNQPSSSSGSLGRKLFDDYQQSGYTVENGYVPGLAFREGHPYIELKESELLRRVSTETQRQFYKEARIKTAAFMGCKNGEIEIGNSNLRQMNMEMEMRKLFPGDFNRQFQLRELPRPPDQNHSSSSSSSLRSLSVESPEYSSIFFNIPTTSNIPESILEAPIEQPTEPTSTGISPQQQQTIQAYHLLRHIRFPAAESDEAAIARAMLTVISSPSSSSSSHQPQQNPSLNYQVSRQTSAFKAYSTALVPQVPLRTNLLSQNVLKHAIAFFRNLHSKRIEDQMRGIRPNTTQLHHMISERKRREKLNESFQALRSILPPGFKKDKASVLSSTRDYLNALKAQVAELKQKNRLLEARLSPAKQAWEVVYGSSNERVNIQVIQASESTSEEREIGLQVTVMGECNMLDLVIRILEFLKQMKDMRLITVESDTQQQQTNSFNRVILRLTIKGSEWDESSFREAIARIVADVAR